MKWPLVGSHGLDVVHKTLAKERVVRALKKLQNRSCGLPQASIRQSDFHTSGAFRQPDSLNPLFSTTHRSRGRWNSGSERDNCYLEQSSRTFFSGCVRELTSVFVILEDQ